MHRSFCPGPGPQLGPGDSGRHDAGRSGIDVLGDLKRVRPKLPVLILSMHPEDLYGKRVLRAEASGYMNKDSAPKN